PLTRVSVEPGHGNASEGRSSMSYANPLQRWLQWTRRSPCSTGDSNKGARLTIPFSDRTAPMTKTIHAIYENGMFRPVEPVNRPERTAVEIELRVAVRTETAPMSEGLAQVYAILGRRHSSGEHDVAARHDEHQP